MITFKIGGRDVRPGDIGNVIQRMMLEQVEEQLRAKLGSIRDPETGEFPTIVVLGDSFDDLKVHVEGSPELIALVERRLAGDEATADEPEAAAGEPQAPRAFLSFTWLDEALAGKIADGLMANGIDTWWAPWCIRAGDSLRRKIEEGLEGCTHFIVLLTPSSIDKPWVNEEMDAGLVLKLSEGRKFIAVRHDLGAEHLPLLLRGQLSPQIGPDGDVADLVNDIYGVTKKPPLGKPPAAVQTAQESKTGYSAAATAVAKFFVEQSEAGTFAAPQISTKELADRLGLSEEDTDDALHELSGMVKTSHGHVLVQDELFATFDRHWTSWNPCEDAVTLAADLVNHKDETFPRGLPEIGKRYGWEPRRLNAAVAYLKNRNLVLHSKAIGAQPWITHWVRETAETRRFVRSRS